MTLFFDVLSDDDKGSALRRAVRYQTSRYFCQDVNKFSKIPGSPFAYWAGDSFLSLFERCQPFKGAKRDAVTGMQTNDNTRWTRLLWEEGPIRNSDTFLVPFAKGGAHRPFYFETYIALRWGEDGRALKEWKLDELRRGLITANNSRCWNEQYYMRPGITWPLRARHFGPQPLPAGCVFSIRGSSAFLSHDELLSTLAIFNSQPFDYLYKLMLGRFEFPEFITGVLQKIPWPDISECHKKQLSVLAHRAWQLRRVLYGSSEISPMFLLPRELLARLGCGAADEQEAQMAAIQSEIDELCYRIYSLEDRDRAEIERWLRRAREIDRHDSDGNNDNEMDDEGRDDDELAVRNENALVSWAVGVASGRFDVRLATGERPLPPEPAPFDPLPVRSPGMLADGDPPFLRCDGILVDDQGDEDDLVARVIAVCDHVGQTAPDPGVLRRSIARDFFHAHVKLYSKSLRKAPIYWQLATPSASYSIWLYYNRLIRETFYAVLSDHIDPKLQHEQRRLGALLADGGGSPNAGQRRQIAEKETFVEELRAFREETARIAPLWNPNHDDGVIINFAPLWRLVPQHHAWQRECKACWDKLVAGDYDWSHLAMHLWPERVVPKCADDRSLAIAHGLEDVFWSGDEDGKWNPRTVPTRLVDELVRERSSAAVKAALKSLLEAPVANGGSRRVRRRAAR